MSDRSLAWAGVAAGSFGILSSLLFALALGFDPGAGTSLAERLVEVDPSDAELVRWAALTDVLGYYLLPLVVGVALRSRLRWDDSLSGDVATTGALVYGTVGATGAVVLGVTAPLLLEDGSQAALMTLETVGTAVEGLWQWLNPLPFTLWMVGIALALRRSRARAWLLFATLAAGGILVWTGRLAGLEAVVTAGLVLWLAPFPFAMASVSLWSNEPASRSGDDHDRP